MRRVAIFTAALGLMLGVSCGQAESQGTPAGEPPTQPADPSTAATRPAASDAASTTTAPAEARPPRSLPEGFVAVAESSTDPSGWPKEIRCVRDGSVMVFVPTGEVANGLTDAQVEKLARAVLLQRGQTPETQPASGTAATNPAALLARIKPGKYLTEEDLKDREKLSDSQKAALLFLDGLGWADSQVTGNEAGIPVEELAEWRKNGRTLSALLQTPTFSKGLEAGPTIMPDAKTIDNELAAEFLKNWGGPEVTNTQREIAELRQSIPAPSPAKVGAFYIDKYEVTNAQYRKYFEQANDPERRPGLWYGPSYNLWGPEHPKFYSLWYDPKRNADDQPVTCVGKKDVLGYAAWTGRQLPTRDQWRRAAVGEGARLFPWGDEWKPGICSSDVTTWASQSPENETEKVSAAELVVGAILLAKDIHSEWKKLKEGIPPAKVGAFPKDCSPFGCFDMAGNVSEWVRTGDGKEDLDAAGGNVETISLERLCPSYDVWADPGRLLGFRTVLPVGP